MSESIVVRALSEVLNAPLDREASAVEVLERAARELLGESVRCGYRQFADEDLSRHRSDRAWLPLNAPLTTRDGGTTHRCLGGLYIEPSPEAAGVDPARVAELARLCDLVAGAIALRRLVCPGERLGPGVFRRLIEECVDVAKREPSHLCLMLFEPHGVSDEPALEGALPTKRMSGSVSGLSAELFVGVEAEQLVSIASRIGEAIEIPGFRAGIASIEDLEPEYRDGWHLEMAAFDALSQARATGVSAALFDRLAPRLTPPAEALLGDIVDVQRPRSPAALIALWTTLEAPCSLSYVEQLVDTTLRELISAARAERAALWRPGRQEGDDWIEIGSAGDCGAPDEASVVEAAIKSDDAIVETEQGRCCVIRCESGGELAAQIVLSNRSHPLACPPSLVSAMRALGRRIGAGLKTVDLFESARNSRREIEDRLRKQAIELRRLLRSRQGLMGTHPKMGEVSRMIAQAAQSNVPILITGETGTGKEVASQLIHRLSRRAGPLVAVNCSAVPAELLESELFGHERGAFTGAESRRIGRFEEADKGTLLLDEIGELPLSLQPKLLRVLQESSVRRIGGDKDVALDLRFVAATNRDLPTMVERGLFRQDLLFRLRVIEVPMPPLRERGDDITMLALYFLRQHCMEIGREPLTLSEEAEAALRGHPWPGNVRELQNRIWRAVVLAHGSEISALDLQLAVPRSRPSSEPIAQERPRRSVSRSRSISERPPSNVPPQVDGAELHVMAGGPEPAAPRGSDLEKSVEDWFWEIWSRSDRKLAPQEMLEAFILRAALQTSLGSLGQAADLVGLHPDTFASHLDRLQEPALSRTVRSHALGRLLESRLTSGKVDRSAAQLMDQMLPVLLRELLVFCRGNKSEMSRILGWGRRKLARHLLGADVRER
jgi:DNA-binding NtrC family response regulator